MKTTIQKDAVFITGGTGFIGSFLALHFLEQKYRVYFLVRKTQTNPKDRFLNHLAKISPRAFDYQSQCIVCEGDITLPYFGIEERLLHDMKIEVARIFHCAALISFESFLKEDAIRTNIIGTKHATETASLLNAELHYISTAYIAGDRRGEVKEDEFDMGQGFKNIYEKTKFEAEKIVQEWLTKGGAGKIYRPSIVVGASRTGMALSFSGYYVIAHFFWSMQKERRRMFFPTIIPVVRGARLNLVPIDTVVSSISSISSNSTYRGRVFHIVHPDPPLVSSVFKSSLSHLGLPHVIIVPVSVMTFRVLTYIMKIVSYALGRKGRFFRRRVLQFASYCDGGVSFSCDNTQRAFPAYAPPPITENLIKKLLDYAISKNFS
jgi:thioester reductase-like protein